MSIRSQLKALRTSTRPCHQLVTEASNATGMKKVRAIQHLFRLKYPALTPMERKKTRKGAYHRVNKPGTGKRNILSIQ